MAVVGNTAAGAILTQLACLMYRFVVLSDSTVLNRFIVSKTAWAMGYGGHAVFVVPSYIVLQRMQVEQHVRFDAILL